MTQLQLRVSRFAMQRGHFWFGMATATVMVALELEQPWCVLLASVGGMMTFNAVLHYAVSLRLLKEAQ